MTSPRLLPMLPITFYRAASPEQKGGVFNTFGGELCPSAVTNGELSELTFILVNVLENDQLKAPH